MRPPFFCKNLQLALNAGPAYLCLLFLLDFITDSKKKRTAEAARYSALTTGCSVASPTLKNMPIKC